MTVHPVRHYQNWSRNVTLDQCEHLSTTIPAITNGTLKLNHNPADSNPAILGNVSLSASTNGNRPVLWLGNNNQLQSTATISATIGGSNSVFTDFVLAGRSQAIAGYTT